MYLRSSTNNNHNDAMKREATVVLNRIHTWFLIQNIQIMH